jgi:hypothetical protein
MPSSSKQTSRLSALLLGVLSCVLIGNTDAGAAAPGEKIDMSAPMGISDEKDLERWMTYYYLHPQPDLLVPALMLADQKGLLQGDAQAPLTAFVSQVMAQNPTRIPGWFQQLQVLKDKSKSVILTALWWSNTKEGKEQLAAVIKSLPEKAQADLQSQCAGNATPIEKMDINSPAVLDELWGAFCATGDEKYVNRLMTTLPWVEGAEKDYNKLMIGGAARWSLTSNAQQHPKVMKLVLRTRDTQPALRKVLDQVVSGGKKTASVPAKTADAK